MKTFILTKSDSLGFKGVAILLMFIHHLFGFPERIKSVYYISIFNYPNFEYTLGSFSKLCVAIFLFLSGYGLVMSSKNKTFNFKELLKKILSVYKVYWIIFIIFIPLKFKLTDIKFNLSEFLLNFIGISSSYNGEWWFFRIYILLLIVYYLYTKTIKIFNYKTLIFSTLLISICFFIPVLIKFKLINTSNVINKISYELDLFALNQTSFFMGCVFAQKYYFSYMKKFSNLLKFKNKFFKVFLLIFIIYLRGTFSLLIFLDFIITPLFLFLTYDFLNITFIKPSFEILGKNSIIMWLSHSFFCYQLFQSEIFYLKYSILILLWLIFLTLVLSITINKIFFKGEVA